MVRDKIRHSWRHFGNKMSPDNQGVFQLMKRETQQAITREVYLAKNHHNIIWYTALFICADPSRSIHAPQYLACDR